MTQDPSNVDRSPSEAGACPDQEQSKPDGGTERIRCILMKEDAFTEMSQGAKPPLFADQSPADSDPTGLPMF